MRRLSHSMALMCLVAAVAPVQAVVVFSENFDTDQSANWTFNSSISGDTAADGFGGEGNAFFDYGALVPSVNGTGGSTRGMKMVANLGTNQAPLSGLAMTLNSQTFDFATKSYKITAQVWLNYYGGTLSGTTEMVNMGVGGSVDSSQLPGAALNGAMFGTTTDGDSSIDWRVYKTPWPATSPTDPTPAVGRVQQNESGVYAAEPDGDPVGTSATNNSHPYYVSHFPGGEVPPDLQKNAFANQQPNSMGMPASQGTVAFAWHRWTVTTTPNGGPISFYVSDAANNDVLIATIQGGEVNPYTLGGNHLFFSMFDINATSPPDGVSADQLLFGLIDNVVVEDTTAPPQVPGDADGDGDVDLDDQGIWAANFSGSLEPGTGTGTFATGDFDGDKDVDLDDQGIWASNFTGSLAPSGLAGVPEPATLGLVGAGAVALAGRRRRK